MLLVLGHPRAESLCGAVAQAYAEGAVAAGATLERLDVGALVFDPDVHADSPARQVHEPDVLRAQRLLHWAEHVVFVYPTWWGTCPARLKGLLDRALTPGFAFLHRPDGTYRPLLGGRTAELITTMDTPPWAWRLFVGAPGHKAMSRATLGFCGLRVVRRTIFGPVSPSSAPQRAKWLISARRLGARLSAGPRAAFQRALGRAGAWVAALRLPFHPMAWTAYAVGALAAPGPLRGGPFWLGLAALFALEVATIFGNELFDYESDRRNTDWGPFTGGSRVLVDGRIAPQAMRSAALWATMTFVGLGAFLVTGLAHPGPAALALGLLALFALGYTVPPLSLCHRGFGELDVGLTHGLGVLLVGHLAQGGAWSAPLPWLLAVPLGLSVLPAITLSALPDRAADAAARKTTLAVRFGERAAARLAMIAAFCAVGAGLLWWLSGLDGGLYGPWVLLAALHGAWLVAGIRRRLREARLSGRIDGLMARALSFTLWFGALPLVHLLAA